MKPKFVFCDEPVSALDASVRAQVLNLMKKIQREMNLTYMFISHDLGVVRFLCNRVGVMYLGRIVELANKEDLYTKAAHPYTQALLSSIPVPDIDVPSERIILKGEIPSPYNPPSGCNFHTRCSYATQRCVQEEPDICDLGDGHYVSCHLYSDKRTS
ncbi:Oligopeptide transport ATP-binding protein OppF [bioreactor metagenome]|uniref:Oligopeptide transport ATP-binding protein OppF n=1 Tax=bioreactor metagenome TaxID=1076179 RepID=A0A645HQ67_9ZZZZ